MMSRVKKWTHLVLGLLLLCMGTGIAQQTIQDFKSKLKNKIRVDVEKLDMYRSLPGNFSGDEKTYLRGGDGQEILVSDHGEPESELHAAINPTDTNNIIVGVMRNNPNLALNPLEFPVYYSTDFGATWTQSSFNGVQTNGLLLAGGGDPVLVFDSEGNAYLSWLTLSINPVDFSGEMVLHFAKSADMGATWTTFDKPIDKGNIVNLFTLDAE